MKMFAMLVVGACAAIALLLAGMIAFGTARPVAPMRSITDVASAIDYRDLPGVSRYSARDGTKLAYRVYPGAADRVAVLVHGSSGSSLAMHALARAIQGTGTTVLSLDMRGHGESGPRGDIAYVGQLEDDLQDLVTQVKQAHPDARLTLVGHSSGGGFVVRVAGGPMSSRFSRFVLLAPYLGFNTPMVRPASGGWAAPYMLRIVALTTLQKFHINLGGGLPVIAFAVPRDLERMLTTSYSFRLFQNFGPPEDYLGALARCRSPVAVVVGDKDEVLFADRFAAALEPVKDHVSLTVLPGVGHMNLVSDQKALEAVISQRFAQ